MAAPLRDTHRHRGRRGVSVIRNALRLPRAELNGLPGHPEYAWSGRPSAPHSSTAQSSANLWRSMTEVRVRFLLQAAAATATAAATAAICQVRRMLPPLHCAEPFTLEAMDVPVGTSGMRAVEQTCAQAVHRTGGVATSRPARQPHGDPHRGPSRVTLYWCVGRPISFVVPSSTSSLVRQFEAARTHGKTWVVEDVEHHVHIVAPGSVRYIRIEQAEATPGRLQSGRAV